MLFTFLVCRDADSKLEAITRLTATNFAGFTVDANYNNLTSGSIASTVDRQSAGVVGFQFSPVIGVDGLGGSSALLWIQTNAKSYIPGNVSLIDGRTTDLTMFGPATPEPSSLMLLGMGILGLFCLGKRKI